MVTTEWLTSVDLFQNSFFLHIKANFLLRWDIFFKTPAMPLEHDGSGVILQSDRLWNYTSPITLLFPRWGLSRIIHTLGQPLIASLTNHGWKITTIYAKKTCNTTWHSWMHSSGNGYYLVSQNLTFSLGLQKETLALVQFGSLRSTEFLPVCELLL